MSDFIPAGDDTILPFAVESLDLRGRAVRLGPALDAIVQRHAYPDAVARVLGEAVALTALLGSSLKFEGRFQLQSKTDGPISLVVADFDTPDRLRAYVQFDPQAIAALGAGPHDVKALLGNGILALTIDPGGDMNRYQGVVELTDQGFEGAADQYFRQSEQIPTRVRLAVAEQIVDGQSRYRAGGILAQFLPTSIERMRQADLPPGDAPEGGKLFDERHVAEDNSWVEAKALLATLEDHELIDPMLASERLLYRLFHEQGVMVFPTQPLREACQCSRERVVAMMRRFSAQDKRDMVGDDGSIHVTCEFCSRQYTFAPDDVSQPED